ncbi:PREDICTED: venom allergen 5-like [Nicrophorus vespilloides]|uniref:Venom allergen 5-like n=1 Tax=Nicrophorus vespilloides TaxID=110193 RepID=A0ABM1M3M7_NICVS|nr:PREDICTED: venom allergen 5-like [Nicrophorus vespilloides]
MILILVAIYLQFAQGIVLEDYCKKDMQNTPCLYRCELNVKCGLQEGDYKVLTNAQRECILEDHNNYRDEMAGGAYVKNHIPKISNMNVLSYDKECEFVTGCYIKQCIWAHDKVRRGLNGKQMGQNLYSMTATKTMTMDCKFLRNALNGWVDSELKYLDANVTKDWGTSYQGFKPAGHLTQVMWAKVKYVGCAMFRSKRKGKKYNVYDIFCNYSPAGNVLKIPVYKAGPPATECRDGQSVNEYYTNLCGVIRPMSQDLYVAPDDAPDMWDESSSCVINISLAPELIIILISSIVNLNCI